MAENNVQELLKGLLKLQKVDGQIYQLRMQARERPAELKSLEAQFEGKQAGLRQLEERLKALQLGRKGQEGELQAKDAAIAKANVQLSQLKTNKEYTAKIKEIEGIKADKSIIEEQILMSYDEGDQVRAQIETERQAVAVEEQKYLAEKKVIEDALRSIDGELRALEAQRQELVPGIDPGFLARYEKILQNKDGLALVPLEGATCGGCYMHVPPQVVNEIRKHEELIYCEMCARILYRKEDFED